MASFLQRNLTLRQLRLVSVLGRTLNLSQCAQAMHTTQPAASRALAQLEALLQVRLFERTTKRIVPTPAGIGLIHHAERILGELELAEASLRDARSGLGGDLRLGALPVFSAERLARAAQRATELLPDLRVQMHTQDAAELYAALLEGRIDLMLAHAEITVDLNQVEVTPLYEEFSSIVAATGHRLARRRRIGWADLAAERWVLPPPNTPLRPKLDRMLSVHRLPQRQHAADVQADSAPLALALVRECGMLWGIADQCAADYERGGLVRRLAAPGALLRGPMCAFRLRKETLGTPQRMFLQCLQEGAAPAAAAAPPAPPGRPAARR